MRCHSHFFLENVSDIAHQFKCSSLVLLELFLRVMHVVCITNASDERIKNHHIKQYWISLETYA